MPCSGLNSAASVTPGACASRSIVLSPLARSAGLVRQQADALAAQPRELLGGEHVDAGQHRLASRDGVRRA